MKRVLGIVFLCLAIVGAAHAQGLIIARLRPGVDPQAIATRFSIDYLDRSYKSPFFLFGAHAGQDLHAIEDAMTADPDVVWAEDDGEFASPENEGIRTPPAKGSTLPAVGGRTTLYAENTRLLKQVNFQTSLANSAGREVRVAILDTGLSSKPTYLWDKVVAQVNYIEKGKRPYDMPRLTDSNGNGVPDEGTGHGSMVAALVDQMAPQTKLVIVRVADSDGNATAWTLIKGLAYATQTGCEVANASLGSLAKVPALTDVLDWCDKKGLLVVAPVGNDNLRLMRYPAELGKVISVAGVQPDNVKAVFSNYRNDVNFSAPATGLASAWWDGDWATWSGTSFGSPVVAGIIADCLRRTAARISPATLRDLLRGAGRGINWKNPDYVGELGTLVDHVRFNDRLNPTGLP